MCVQATFMRISQVKNIRKFGEEIERLKLKQQILKRIKLENIIEEKTYIN